MAMSSDAHYLSRNVVAGYSALLLAIVAVVYAPFLGNAFIFDDLNLFNGVRIYDFAAELWRIQPRWLSYATLAHTYALSDGSIFMLRLGNLLLHAANAAAVFLLLRSLLLAVDDRGIPAIEDQALAARLAFLASVIFAV